MHEREHKESSTSLQESKLFFAVNIGKCDLKKNYEEKRYPHLSFYGDFFLNRVDIHVIYVKKSLTKMDI